MKKMVCLLLVVLTSASALPAQKSTRAQRIQAVENSLCPYVPVEGFAGWNLLDRMKYYHVPGVSVAVIRNFKIDWAKGYGWADTTRRVPVTTETMFSAGSISKLVLAAAALRLVQEGKISLDEPVNQYLRSWKIADNDFTQKTPVTLRMLLSHTGGTSQSSYFGFTPDTQPLPTLVEILSGAPAAETRPVVVNSAPGVEFRYSGGGSLIAQQALCDVSGQDFEALLRALVFDRLGMPHSTFAQPLPPRFADQAAWAYSAASWFKGMPYVYPQQAAAGLYSTPSDLARLLIDLQQGYRGQGKLLSQNLVRQMFTPQAKVSDGGYREEIGVGPFLLQRTDNTAPDGVYFEFTGVNAGFLAYAIASVTDGNGVVVMLNSGDDVNGLGKEIRRAVAQVYGWKNFLPEKIRPVVLPSAALDAAVGRYRKGPDEVLTLRRERNYWVENINGGTDIYCFPVATDTLVFTDFNVKGWLVRNAAGQITGLQSQWQQQPMPRMADDEFTPGEHLLARRYAEAKAGYGEMHLNVYALTYLIYNQLHQKPLDLNAARALLELATEQYPNEAIVYQRWGDYHLAAGDRANALASFRKALALEPDNKEAREQVQRLER